jgi:hypothetical protein
MAAVAGAGIPDADASSVTLDAGGLTTCPAGDGSTFDYINVTALRSDLTPIAGIPSGSFFFTVSGTGSGNVSISAFDSETNVGGVCRFQANGDGAVPYGSLDIEVQIYTVVLTGHGTLWCNTFDYNDDGSVGPVDFGQFAGDFGGTNQRSDFNWDGSVGPVDFGQFASHFGH